MTIAIWIIAICETIRIIQNSIQLSVLLGEREMRKDLNNEFVDSLRKDNQEWTEDLLKVFLQKTHNDDEWAEEKERIWK